MFWVLVCVCVCVCVCRRTAMVIHVSRLNIRLYCLQGGESPPNPLKDQRSQLHASEEEWMEPPPPARPNGGNCEDYFLECDAV
jgi:hypothetical protein